MYRKYSHHIFDCPKLHHFCRAVISDSLLCNIISKWIWYGASYFPSCGSYVQRINWNLTHTSPFSCNKLNITASLVNTMKSQLRFYIWLSKFSLISLDYVTYKIIPTHGLLIFYVSHFQVNSNNKYNCNSWIHIMLIFNFESITNYYLQFFANNLKLKSRPIHIIDKIWFMLISRFLSLCNYLLMLG